ncbi:MAG: transcription elongation factor GreA [Bacteroidetes bacterium]|jgi:transcription elongation factor GreA|nr:transcription elongation factor GreA [Bacteroidota bacterium]MBT3751714.1 transcription elongation factor GreA [Bacteroidota bacterium]MBT4402147.1 transcription elongation factor GreA [Bacteroidota bacterium]MBT4410573.1 transcription elongation factor GreA [Bacteroidota bacterium]MBT5426670.1 transcription elongation factor GreA [Bacteroidota bacterium]
MNKLSYMTAEGMQKLRDDLEQMMNIERPSISRQIAEARDKGDLSENAEYDAAKEAQGLLEMRIARLQDTLAHARLIDESKLTRDGVQILSTVKIRNIKTNTEMSYIIVSESEADLKHGKLSISTPIAKGLLGKKVGDKVEITVPSGVIPFEIVDITF